MSEFEIRWAEPPLRDAVVVAADAFGLAVPPADYQVNLADKIASPYVFSAWRRESGRLLGFAGYDFLGHLSIDERPVAYLHALAIAPCAQTVGVGAALLDTFARVIARPFVLTMRTQSPIMMQLVASRARAIFPSPDGDHIPTRLRVLGEESARITGSRFPRDAGSYGRALYPKLPRHRDPAVQAWFDRMCPDRDAGDAAFFIALIDGPRDLL